MTGSAKQSIPQAVGKGCFVAFAPPNDGERFPLSQPLVLRILRAARHYLWRAAFRSVFFLVGRFDFGCVLRARGSGSGSASASGAGWGCVLRTASASI